MPNKLIAISVRNWHGEISIIINRKSGRKDYKNVTGWSRIRVANTMNSLQLSPTLMIFSDNDISVLYEFQEE